MEDSFELISSQPRSAALKVDWAKVTTSLGLRGQTAASLQAFKQRNENARRRVQALSEQPTTVDFAHYRSVLKNQAVVAEVERRFKEFKPAAYDVQRQLKAIDAFEVEAVRNAQAAKEKVELELKDLQATLKNIETARPFDELTVVRVMFFSVDVEKEEEEEEEGEKMDEGDDEDEVMVQMRCDARQDETGQDEMRTQD